MSPDAIRLAFVTLEAAGFSPPKAYANDEGLENGVAVYAAVLDELTPEELGHAIQAWLRGTSPFWPKPGELLALVDLVEESFGRYGEGDRHLEDRRRWRARRRARARVIASVPREAITFEPVDPSKGWRGRQRRVLPLDARRRLAAIDRDEEGGEG
jgi:hypothetical protein